MYRSTVTVPALLKSIIKISLLVPSKYIEFVNRDENIDFDEKMKSLQTDFASLLKEEEKSRGDLFESF
jgi:type I restriction enzyme M protein